VIGSSLFSVEVVPTAPAVAILWRLSKAANQLAVAFNHSIRNVEEPKALFPPFFDPEVALFDHFRPLPRDYDRISSS
jgi:hypothetical protein